MNWLDFERDPPKVKGQWTKLSKKFILPVTSSIKECPMVLNFGRNISAQMEEWKFRVKGQWPWSKSAKNLSRNVLTLISPGYFGGWVDPTAPPPPPFRSQPWIAKGRVWCKLQDCIVRLFFIIIFYFIWINYANLCNKKKSYFTISR